MVDARAPLPRVCAITPEPPAAAAWPVFLGQLDHVLGAGVGLIQLRAKAMPAADYARLAEAVAERCRASSASLILNPPAGCDPARCAGDGVHFSSATLQLLRSRPLPAARLLSAACHDLAQLRQAERVGADLVTLSPVLPTATHPGAPALGWARFAELAGAVDVPVYALGGVGPDVLELARAHHAYGVAAIRALWPMR